MKKAYQIALYLALFSGISQGQDLIFNQNNLPSDTEGELKATVLLAQNSIIPTKNKIANDIQPRLIAHRKTLILFQPKELIAHNEPIQVSITNKNDASIKHSLILKSPAQLPTIPGINPNVDLSTLDFSEPTSYGHTIQGGSNLTPLNLDSAGKIINDHLQTKQNLLIKTADGSWTGNFFLPSTAGNSGKKIVFSSNAGYTSTIHLKGSSKTISRGETLVFVAARDQWVSEADKELTRIKYGKEFWTTVIPTHLAKPGLELTFQNNNKTGILDDLEFGGYTEVIINTINLGMLTPYADAMLFQSNSEYQRQYYQQIPTSRLIVSSFEPQYFTEIVLPDGTYLDDKDHTSDGGVYDGSMRGNIGKNLVSLGIDFANYGIFSSTSQREKNYLASQVTAHKSIGKYRNGIHQHGLSGGAGMATLTSTIGNEFSHELGHNWGLGHYVGSFAGSVHRPADQINSTWGWDSDSNVFIPNFNNSQSNDSTCVDNICQQSFHGFSFNKDAMAGGSPTFISFNNFTLHTPFVLERIQKFYESKMVFAFHKKAGFEKWNPNQKKMIEYNHKAKFDNDSISMVPTKQGVPVTTILGFYDPQKTLRSYIYPALHGSYGMTYDSPTQASTSCKLKVEVDSGDTLSYSLNSTRFDTGFMNKFHVNVATSLKPKLAILECGGTELNRRVLDAPQFVLKSKIWGLSQTEEEKTVSLITPQKNLQVNDNIATLHFGKQTYQVHLRNDQKQFSILDTKGQLVKQVPLTSNGIRWNGDRFDGSSAQPGVYYISINGFKKPLFLQ